MSETWGSLLFLPLGVAVMRHDHASGRNPCIHVRCFPDTPRYHFFQCPFPPRLMGMCFRAPFEKSLHHASINSGRLGRLHTIVQPREHTSTTPLLQLLQASLFSQTFFLLCRRPHLILSSLTFSPSRLRFTTLQTPFGNALPPNPDVGSIATPSSLTAGAHFSTRVNVNS